MSAMSFPYRQAKTFRPIKKKHKLDKHKKMKPVSLSFETERIIVAKQAVPVNLILMNASYTEELSFQPTVKLELSANAPEIVTGDTLMNRVGKRDFFRTQAYMLVAISGMGLLIGFFIAYFIWAR